jgi:hypothetical protein
VEKEATRTTEREAWAREAKVEREATKTMTWAATIATDFNQTATPPTVRLLRSNNH